jgi:hypothetical protein
MISSRRMGYAGNLASKGDMTNEYKLSLLKPAGGPSWEVIYVDVRVILLFISEK